MSPREGAPVVGVLLAAGAGQRLGRGPKALLTLGEEPEVVRMADALLRGGCDEVVVVAGAASERVRGLLDGVPDRGRCLVVVNADWPSGMGSSFRTGIDAADRLVAGRRGGSAGGSVMVALVDQPDIDAAVVAHLVGAASGQADGQRVTAAGFPDAQGHLVRGHPVVFPLPLARDAAAMAVGDAAGRAWLRAHPGLVDVVDVGHLATGRDVDTPDDLERWVGVDGRA